jgi:integrase
MVMASIKGRLTAELYLLFERMKAFSESKKEAKMKARREGKPFYYYYNGKIFSHGTFETYKPKVKRFLYWCNDKFQVNCIVEIKHGMFREYIAEKLPKLKPNTIKTLLAAIAKFGEGIKKSESFHRVSKQIQKTLPKDEISRPTYLNANQALQVLKLVEQDNPRYGLAMRVQLETACRVCEIDRLRIESLLGFIQQEEQIVGVLSLRGKGNRIRQVSVGEEIYRQLKQALNEKRKLISYDGYRTAVYRASESLGLHSGGTHKARRFSVQQLVKVGYRELRSQGLSSREASINMLHEANRQLGHSPERTSTTILYLNK